MMGKLSINLKVFNMRLFLTEILNLTNSFARENGLKIIKEFEYNDIPEYFSSDEERLK